jgi:hypothetical protein
MKAKANEATVVKAKPDEAAAIKAKYKKNIL